MSEVTFDSGEVTISGVTSSTVFSWAIATEDIEPGRPIRVADESAYLASNETEAESEISGMSLNTAVSGQQVMHVATGQLTYGDAPFEVDKTYVLGVDGAIIPIEDIEEDDWISTIGSASTTSVLDLTIEVTGGQTGEIVGSGDCEVAYLDIDDYGVVSKADDADADAANSVAMQALIDSIGDTVFGSIYIPPAEYEFSDGLDITADVEIIGTGTSKFTWTGTANEKLLTVGADCTRAALRGLTIEGQCKAFALSSAETELTFSVKDCVFEDCARVISGSTRPLDLVFQNNRVNGTTSYESIGIYFYQSNLNRVDIKDNTFDSCKYPIALQTTDAPNGYHDGGDGEAVLEDSGESFVVDAYIGRTLFNSTDGSKGIITDNDETMITATLAGGENNDWDTDDRWSIGPPSKITIDNNRITDSWSTGGDSCIPIFVRGGDMRITNNYIEGNIPDVTGCPEGQHTGGDGVSVLVDVGESWTVDEYDGYTLFNLTQDTSGVITENTADTITATGMSWDTDDDYYIGTWPELASDHDAIYCSYAVKGSIISGNVLINAGNWGIQVKSGTCIVANNLIEFNDSGHYQASEDYVTGTTPGTDYTCGISLSGAEDTLVSDNFINGAHYGLWYQDSSDAGQIGHVTFQGNHLKNIVYQGVHTKETCSDFLVQGNYIEGAPIGIYFQAWPKTTAGGESVLNSTIIGNTITNCSTRAILVYCRESATKRGPFENITIAGNIVLECADGISVTKESDDIPHDNLVITNNVLQDATDIAEVLTALGRTVTTTGNVDQ